MKHERIARLDTEKLKKYIDENDTSMSEIARLFGVSPSAISRFLNKKRSASGDIWSGFVGLFGKRIFEFIFFESNVSNDTNKEVGAK